MVIYEKSKLKVAEVFFDEPASSAAADIIRYHYRTVPVSQWRTSELQTLWIDLTAGPDSILSGMNADTRHKIRRAAKDDAVYESQSQPDETWMTDFFQFYDRFAAVKGLPPANRIRLKAMQQHGMLDLSRVCGVNDQVLVWHAHVRGNDRARLLHSASVFRELDKEAANRVGRANRLHHWADMLRFRDEGLPVYDFGGWYGGSEDEAKLRINEFKRGFGGRVVAQYNADRPGTWKGAAALGLRTALRVLRGVED
jgi:hypothetical protein